MLALGPYALLWGIQIGTATKKTHTSMVVPQKLKTELSHGIANALLGIYPKEFKAGSQRDICLLCSSQYYS